MNRYKVLLRENATGEERLVDLGVDWQDHSESWWTDGNGGCDCNRADFFKQAIDPDYEDEDCENPCGHSAYTAVKAILSDGTEVILDPDR